MTDRLKLDRMKLIDVLTGDNYAVWKTRMRAILISKGYWRVVNPSPRTFGLPEPEDQTTEVFHDATDPSSQASRDTTAHDNDLSDKELDLIILSLANDQMVHVEACRTARSAWGKLKQLYEEPSTANKMRLYDQFLSAKLEGNESAQNHLQSFAALRNELSAVGINIDEDLYKLGLLRSMPYRFEAFKIAIEAQLDNINVEELHARINREEHRQEALDKSGSHSAHSANKRIDSRSVRQTRVETRTCR